MAHYAMLDEYQFSENIDDIRGTTLYSADNHKLGRVADVIFDHDTGAIQYLVVDLGHNRKTLVPSNHIYRSIANEDDFETDIPAAQVERLPRFDASKLKHDREWAEHQEEHRRAWQEQEERLLQQYKNKWQESPVQHQQGSDRNVTPEEAPAAQAGDARERIVTGADLTPRRIAGKFPGADTMVVPGNPDAGETTLRPTVDVEGVNRFGKVPPNPRVREFEEGIRQELGEIRIGCKTCCPTGGSRAA